MKGISIVVVPAFITTKGIAAAKARKILSLQDKPPCFQPSKSSTKPTSAKIKTIASIANISAWLKSTAWNAMGISESLWVIILIGVATILSSFIILVRRNIPFGFVVLWALYGIILKRKEVDHQLFESVINAAYTAFVIILIVLSIRILKKNSTQSPLNY